MNAYDLLIIGGGMAAGKLLQRLDELDFTGSVVLIGAEQSIGYNRVLLPKYLSGQCEYKELIGSQEHWLQRSNFTLRTGVSVAAIDLELSLAQLDSGETISFRELVFATGSTVPKPNIPGIHSAIVAELRCLTDAYRLKTLAQNAEYGVVVGGGLLGLEAADALCELGVQVRIVHRGERLMTRQLDQSSGQYLQADLNTQGIEVSLNATVTEIHTTQYLQAGEVRLSDGSICPADLVVFATGVVANDKLARKAGVECDQGIVTNLCLQTDHAGVYALGECAKVAGVHHQLVEAVYAQADALAQTLCGEVTAVIVSPSNTRLKMRHTALFTAGDITAGPSDDILVNDPTHGIYRRLFFAGPVLSGALLFGDTTASREITAHIGECIGPEQRERLAFGMAL